MNYQAHPTRADAAVWALEIDDTGRVWAGLDDGVVVLHPPSAEDTKGPHPWAALVRETISDRAVTHPPEKHGPAHRACRQRRRATRRSGTPFQDRGIATGFERCIAPRTDASGSARRQGLSMPSMAMGFVRTPRITG